VNVLNHFGYNLFLVILEKMGVTEMGRKSDKQTGCVTVGTGVKIAFNHDAASVVRNGEKYLIIICRKSTTSFSTS